MKQQQQHLGVNETKESTRDMEETQETVPISRAKEKAEKHIQWCPELEKHGQWCQHCRNMDSGAQCCRNMDSDIE